jgi:hypothetical protein
MTDLQGYPDADGPWRAVLAWSEGYVVDDLDEITAPDECRIQIARSNALPRDDGDGSLRLPGSWTHGNLLVEFDGDDYETVGELLELWSQAQAMVDGLNRDTRPVAADAHPPAQSAPAGEVTSAPVAGRGAGADVTATTSDGDA